MLPFSMLSSPSTSPPNPPRLRPSCSSATYDANGNSLNDTFRPATWDADSNPITIGPVSLTYDAFDRMVEQSVGGTYSEIVYSPAGVKLALMHGTTLTKAFAPLPGGATAVYTSSGLAYYRHTDHLGSSRFASTPTQTLYSDTAYSPFGEPYASSGAIDNSFTGQNQDTTAGLYDFLFREYDPNQARWTSPDPSGLSAVTLADPQSLNRYAYVSNRPLSFIDQFGLSCMYYDDSGDEIESIDYDSSPEECGGSGGSWMDNSGGSSLDGNASGSNNCVTVGGVQSGCSDTNFGQSPDLGNIDPGDLFGLGGNSSGGFSWMGGGGNSSDNNKTTQLKDFNACVDQASSVENRQLLSTSAEIVGSGFVFVTVGWLCSAPR